jgi:hypothetical protein
MFMNECIDSTMGRIPRMLAELLASDDPRTSWSFHHLNKTTPKTTPSSQSLVYRHSCFEHTQVQHV